MDRNKVITGVFLTIAILIIAMILWSVFLGKEGIIQRGWNTVAETVNASWKKVTGSSEDVVPKWRIGDTNTKDALDNMEGNTSPGGVD